MTDSKVRNKQLLLVLLLVSQRHVQPIWQTIKLLLTASAAAVVAARPKSQSNTHTHTHTHRELKFGGYLSNIGTDTREKKVSRMQMS